MTKPASEGSATLAIHGAIAAITLDRPDRLNVIDAEAVATLLGHVRMIERRSDIRVVVIKGAGRGFCAGGDIGLMAAHLDDIRTMVRGLLTDVRAFLVALRSLPAIVVTSVHGAVAGGGFSLAFMGDLCIAADTARFTPAYAELGISPDVGGTVGLVEIVGVRRAMQIFLAETNFDAAQAQAWGLVNKVVPEDRLEAETMVLARRLASINAHALGATKRLLWASPGTPLAQQLDAEMEAVIACTGTEAFREAVGRFVSSARRTQAS
jgi:enoyl-CoA hydratase/carnithine racemase